MKKIAVYNTLFTNGKPALVMELEREYSPGNMLDNPNKLTEMLCNVFYADRATEERMYLLCMDSKCNLMGVFHLAHGSVSLCTTSMREVFMKALLTGCSSIIVAHNHPSGITDPSGYDTAITKQLVQAGTIMSIPLLDHLIIGNGGKYFSYKESGMLDNQG